MAIKATFSPGFLSVSDDNADNSIIMSRDAAGRILVNGGAVADHRAELRRSPTHP